MHADIACVGPVDEKTDPPAGTSPLVSDLFVLTSIDPATGKHKH